MIISAFVKPYVLSILPAASALSLPLTATRSGTAAAASQPRVQVRSTLSLSNVQTLSHPFVEPSADDNTQSTSSSVASVLTTPTPASQNVAMRLLTASPGATSPAFLLTTPTDKAAAAAQGSTIWLFTMQNWGAQIDGLVDVGKYEEALMLLDTIDPTVLEDKVRHSSILTASQLH